MDQKVVAVTSTNKQPVLQARGIVKRFGRVVALDNADFELYPGEILGVIGDNGAGKSTLIKVLTGAVIPDSGETLHGRPADLVSLSPRCAERRYRNGLSEIWRWLRH